MISLFIVPLCALALLVVLFVWTLRPRRRNRDAAPPIESTNGPARHPATYLGLIRQAMAEEDFEFLAAHGPTDLVRRTQKERRRIAILYLVDLRADFQRLSRLARIITVLSPEVAASHELERLRLSIRFYWRYRLVLLGLYAGLLSVPQLSRLSEMVSDLAFRMQSAMNDLGDRAAFAAELASTPNRRGVDVA